MKRKRSKKMEETKNEEVISCDPADDVDDIVSESAVSTKVKQVVSLEPQCDICGSSENKLLKHKFHKADGSFESYRTCFVKRGSDCFKKAQKKARGGDNPR